MGRQVNNYQIIKNVMINALREGSVGMPRCRRDTQTSLPIRRDIYERLKDELGLGPLNESGKETILNKNCMGEGQGPGESMVGVAGGESEG